MFYNIIPFKTYTCIYTCIVYCYVFVLIPHTVCTFGRVLLSYVTAPICVRLTRAKYCNPFSPHSAGEHKLAVGEKVKTNIYGGGDQHSAKMLNYIILWELAVVVKPSFASVPLQSVRYGTINESFFVRRERSSLQNCISV